jgi:hypothetical protein
MLRVTSASVRTTTAHASAVVSPRDRALPFPLVSGEERNLKGKPPPPYSDFL